MSAFISVVSQSLHISPLATRIGIFCLTSQLILTFLFDRRTKILPLGPWSDLPAFTAHQVVSFPFMILLSYYGWKEWEFDMQKFRDDNTNTLLSAHDRVFSFSNTEDIPLAYGTGAILMWDIPIGLLAPSLREPLMIAHHVGMFLVAAVMSGMFSSDGQMIGYYYVPFYFGVIETSSIFLSVVDQFHPKRKAWYAWLNNIQNDSERSTLVKFVNQVNDLSRMFFALSFLVFRGIYFPYTSIVHAIPDVWRAYENPPDGVPMWTCYFLCLSLCLFSCLQSYWGVLVARQIKKSLFGGEDDKEGKKKKR